MGLDMYLHKSPIEKEYGLVEVCYWRKANAIHNWFVHNLGVNVRNCDYHEVSKTQLEALLAVCRTVLTESALVKGKVWTGARLSNGQMEDIYQDGKVVINTEIANSLLPTAGGFFFGSTDYDEWYIHHISHTVDALTAILAETDFTKYKISYLPSW